MPDARKKLLVIDDVELNRAILREAFCKKFDILEAENGIDGLALIKQNASKLSAILLDIIMPEMDGFTVLQELEHHELLRHVPVFLISTETTDYVVQRAYNYGVVDVISKPFNLPIIERRINNIIELFENRNQLEKMFNQQMATIAVQDSELQKNQWAIIETLSSALEGRDAESGDHVKRMCDITNIFLKELAVSHPEYTLTDEKIKLITRAAALHDIGKIAIRDAILLKPGKLTPEEFEIMKTHTTEGCKIIDSIAGFKTSKLYTYSYQICRSHHERWNGKGYPDGLVGNDIPIAAQIVSVADVYDALISKRVYKPEFTHEQACHMIESGECGVFNPDLLECFRSTIDDIYETMYAKRITNKTFKA
jgi:putative two-component system response regulator